MKKISLLSLALLMSLPGCWSRKSTKSNKQNRQPTARTSRTASAQNDMAIKNFFDDTTQEFTTEKELFIGGQIENLEVDDFAIIDKQELVNTDFETIYFDFDTYALRPDQETKIQKAVGRIKKILEETKFFGKDSKLPTFSIAGHSCDSAGDRIYNLILSEKRAKTLCDRFVQEGISAECIKIIGYGSEVPAIVDGKQVTGDRMAQAPNRRDEIRIIYS